MALNAERIEERIDRVEAANIQVQAGFGGVRFQTMVQVMEFAKMMAVSGAAVPPHLRLNPGACLAICTKAERFGFDPFALAEHSFVMKKSVDVTVEHESGGRSTVKQDVEVIAYDSYVIRAIINAWAPIKGGIKYRYEGEGDARVCIATCTRKSGETIEHKSQPLGERKASIGRNQQGKLKGSPLWESKPDQQQAYDTGRDLCRVHFPEVVMGWYDKDEFDEEAARAATATDVTPKLDKPDVGKRLKGPSGKKQGFDGKQVEQAAEEAAGDKEPVADKKSPATGEQQVQTSQDEPKVSEPLARGQRLLDGCKTPKDVTDLQESIQEELKGLELDLWLSACTAKFKTLGAP